MIKNILTGDASLQADFLAGRACATYGVVALRDRPLTDVLDIGGGGKEASKAKFGFVVCAHEGMPLFAVDVFGKPKPKAKARSKAKRRLCRKASFPLFTVRSPYLDNDRARSVVLAWCIELWFTHGKDSLQQEIWPKDFFSDIDLELDKLKALAGYRSFRLSLIVGEGGGELHGLATIIVNDSFGWCAKGTVSSTCPIGFEGDMLKVIVVKDAYGKYIDRMAENKYKTKRKIKKKWKTFRKEYQEQGCGSFGWGK
jgi:hypothetical protein